MTQKKWMTALVLVLLLTGCQDVKNNGTFFEKALSELRNGEIREAVGTLRSGVEDLTINQGHWRGQRVSSRYLRQGRLSDLERYLSTRRVSDQFGASISQRAANLSLQNGDQEMALRFFLMAADFLYTDIVQKGAQASEDLLQNRTCPQLPYFRNLKYAAQIKHQLGRDHQLIELYNRMVTAAETCSISSPRSHQEIRAILSNVADLDSRRYTQGRWW